MALSAIADRSPREAIWGETQERDGSGEKGNGRRLICFEREERRVDACDIATMGLEKGESMT